ncbi:11958_t:CDS:2 [Dentiscutata erythropus]|uniref:11958_t:CDS:1 n=1 Tax=Dentiscutata erythropus TaxID=1348616 RepID=A0A9N9CJ40_9GLOM|nr:11958_t:CDS:2 [Dentiscutata erythropus]
MVLGFSRNKDASASEELCSKKVRPKVPLEQNSKLVPIQPEETKVSHDYIVAQNFIQEVSSEFTDEKTIKVIDVLTTNMTIEVELAHLFLKVNEKVRPKVPLEHVSNTDSTNIISRADMTKKTSSIAQASAPSIFEPEVNVSISPVSVNSKTKISVGLRLKLEKKLYPRRLYLKSKII